MKQQAITYPTEKKALYRLIITQIQGLTDGISDLVANLANVSALLNQALTDINWVGFYLIKDGRLILGPFQGKPACVEIQIGCGVCGTAVEKDEIILVEDVHEFPGHIACDSALGQRSYSRYTKMKKLSVYWILTARLLQVLMRKTEKVYQELFRC